ncbi:MAG TPA: GNAT family N-acetyltransferase [Candidatus Dormibacteraeota bacterium]|nr:GNAT family N-acetyltransferase [Candidatus Dormibacteraeota bacterium]
MPKTTLSIRPATREDVRFLAWAVVIATRSHLPKGWFDVALDRPEPYLLDFIGRLTLSQERSFWHYSYFFVAEAEGKSVAALSVFPAREGYTRSSDAMIETMTKVGLSDAEQQAVWKRADYLWSCVLPSENDPDLWAIENVAILPEYRGDGLAGPVLEHAIAEARSKGASQVQITFYIGNDAAERAYAKAGFKFKDEKRHSDFEAACGSAGLRRFARLV